jgi:hypothetical protein
MSFEGGHTVPTTKEIKLPRDWKERLANKARSTETA